MDNFLNILNLIVILGIAFYFWNQNKNADKAKEDKKQLLGEILEEAKKEIAGSINERHISELKNQLDSQLKPFGTQMQREIDQLKKNIEREMLERAKDGAKFGQQIEDLLNATSGMQEDAQSLTKALKGDSQQQGAWGEQILETALEKAGLQENINYLLQPNYKDRQGNNLRPDAVILLPNDRNIVIDSKVSLTAYERFVNTENEDDKKSYLKEHIQSIKGHIKNLSSKNYNDLEDINAPDYLFIFIPIDSALSVALMNDWDLQTLANEKKIAFATPINLLAILRIAENLWRLDSQNKHAEDIANRAGLLYDKFSNFTKDLFEVGKHLDRAKESYDSAQNKLIEGDGNLFTQVDKLKVLGAKTQKTLSKPKPKAEE
jgi:DNA recombination protein RmuC